MTRYINQNSPTKFEYGRVETAADKRKDLLIPEGVASTYAEACRAIGFTPRPTPKPPIRA